MLKVRNDVFFLWLMTSSELYKETIRVVDGGVPYFFNSFNTKPFLYKHLTMSLCNREEKPFVTFNF